jgi:hypothetical protein
MRQKYIKHQGAHRYITKCSKKLKQVWCSNGDTGTLRGRAGTEALRVIPTQLIIFQRYFTLLSLSCIQSHKWSYACWFQVRNISFAHPKLNLWLHLKHLSWRILFLVHHFLLKICWKPAICFLVCQSVIKNWNIIVVAWCNIPWCWLTEAPQDWIILLQIQFVDMPTHVANHISTTSDFSPHTSLQVSKPHMSMAVARWSFLHGLNQLKFSILLKGPVFKALVHKTCMLACTWRFTLKKENTIYCNLYLRDNVM